jgi:multidrug efflux pump subunit AcrA (membrane-fusion protein)
MTTEVSKYPWTHLFSDFPDDIDDDIVDIVEVQSAQMEMKRELLSKDQTISSNHRTIEDLKTISQTTFDDMEQTIQALQIENKKIKEQTELDREAAEDLLRRSLEDRQNTDPIAEILPIVVTQTALAHSRGLNPIETRKKILLGVHKWLQQRHKIVQYLTDNQLFPEQVEVLSEILSNLNKPDLMVLVEKFSPEN